MKQNSRLRQGLIPIKLGDIRVGEDGRTANLQPLKELERMGQKSPLICCSDVSLKAVAKELMLRIDDRMSYFSIVPA